MEKRLGEIFSPDSAWSKFIVPLQVSYTSTSAAVDSQHFQVSLLMIKVVHTSL